MLDAVFKGWVNAALSFAATAFVFGTICANCEFAFAPLAAIRSPGLRSIGTLVAMAVAYTAVFIRHPHPFYMLLLLWFPVAAVYLAIFFVRLFRSRG